MKNILKEMGLISFVILVVGLLAMMMIGAYLDLPVFFQQGWIAQRIALAQIPELLLCFCFTSFFGAVIGLWDAWIVTV